MNDKEISLNLKLVSKMLNFYYDRRHCVSGSLDGKLIIWDTWSGNKVQVNILLYKICVKNIPKK